MGLITESEIRVVAALQVRYGTLRDPFGDVVRRIERALTRSYDGNTVYTVSDIVPAYGAYSLRIGREPAPAVHDRDVFGLEVGFEHIELIWVINHSEVSGEYLTIGGGANPIWQWAAASSDRLVLQSGGHALLQRPDDFDVGATEYYLRLEAHGEATPFSALIVGTMDHVIP